MAKLIRTGLLALGAFAVACGGSDSLEPQETPNNNPNTTEVELSGLAIDLGAIDLTVVLGTRADLKVEGQYSDGTSLDLTAEASWVSSNEGAARFVGPGKLVTVGTGVATITVTYEDQSISEELVVEAPIVTSLELDPPLAIVGIGETGGGIQIRAKATYSDDTVLDVTEEISEARGWASSDRTIGFMSATDIGRLSLFGPEGEVVITATFEGVQATGRYVATGPVVEELEISPGQVRVQVGNEPAAVTVQGFRSADGMFVDLTNDVVWSVDDPTIATFADGMVQPVAPGNTFLRATFEVTVAGVTTELDAAAEVRVVDESSTCPYPDFNPNLSYDDALAPHMWTGAYDEQGNLVDLSLEELHCDGTVSTIAFVIGAGWCPFCPAFKQVVDSASPQLEELGMKVVYVEIETNSGAPATHEQANAIVNRTERIGRSTRIGAFDDEESLPFAGVRSLPNLVVVRTSDMKVIRRGRRDDLATMAADPSQLYGDAW